MTGFLNFLNRAIVPGRAFMRRMYAKFTGLDKKLKPHHHIKVDTEFKSDCKMWLQFLSYDVSMVSRPYVDLSVPCETAENLKFTSDATANEVLGFGTIFDNQWTFGRWEDGFINSMNHQLNSWNSMHYALGYSCG